MKCKICGDYLITLSSLSYNDPCRCSRLMCCYIRQNSFDYFFQLEVTNNLDFGVSHVMSVTKCFFHQHNNMTDVSDLVFNSIPVNHFDIRDENFDIAFLKKAVNKFAKSYFKLNSCF